MQSTPAQSTTTTTTTFTPTSNTTTTARPTNREEEEEDKQTIEESRQVGDSIESEAARAKTGQRVEIVNSQQAFAKQQQQSVAVDCSSKLAEINTEQKQDRLVISRKQSELENSSFIESTSNHHIIELNSGTIIASSQQQIEPLEKTIRTQKLVACII